MRWMLFVGVGGLLALPWACGGKTVIDGEPGTGGAATTTTTATSNGGAPNGGPGPGNQTQTSVFVSTAAGPPPPPPLCELQSGDGDCNDCAFNFCQFELGNCCSSTGCIALVECVIEECEGAQDEQACAISQCPNEVGAAAASGSTAEAEQLGECLSGCGCG